jgi:hypothetical protein
MSFELELEQQKMEPSNASRHIPRQQGWNLFSI